MTALLNFYRSTVGKKIAMALSGLVLVGFVVGHMAGNLKYFMGKDSGSGVYFIDHYGEVLRQIAQDFLGPMTFLWIVRVVLLGCLVIHVLSAISLTRLNRAAKGAGYQNTDYRSANAASRTMVYGGLFLLAFIVYHLLHLTTGDVHYLGFVHGQVYGNVYSAFQNVSIVSFYVAAMAFLAMHLYHGTWSMFQTLGVTSPIWNQGIRTVAKIVAVVLFIGFSSLPLATFLNKVPAPDYREAQH